MRNIKKLLALCLAVVAIGCSVKYSFTGTNLSPDVKTVYREVDQRLPLQLAGIPGFVLRPNRGRHFPNQG